MSLGDLRKEYSARSLAESDVAADPFSQFQRWFDEVLRAQLVEPNAMTLATVGPDGRPSARILLLKGVDPRGFVFFSNYQSRKGQELAQNAWAALVFYWPELERQVRVEGRCTTIDPADSETYFQSRPLGSRIGAIASHQSEVIPSRAWLEQRWAALEAAHMDGVVQRPEHWGGYRLMPDAVEFWQGRPSRLHDRLRYRLDDTASWRLERLSP